MGKSVHKLPKESTAEVGGVVPAEVRELCRLLARILRRGDNLPKGDTPENEPDEEILESD